MPRRVVFGEIISHVEFSLAPDDLEVVLFDSIMKPMVAHIECFGEFRTNGCIEDACCSGVIVE